MTIPSRFIAVSSLALAAGCASAPIRIRYEQAPNLIGPGTHAVISEVLISPKFYARGCTDLTVKDGTVRVIVQQDGTSDYAGIRVAPLLVRDAVSAALAFAEAPINLLERLLGVPNPPQPGPSEIHGCGGVTDGD